MAAIFSETQIGNMALSHLGKALIESFDQKGEEARLCKLWYHPSRLATLEDYDWSFARKRLALSEHNEDPPADWAYRYTMPGDVAVFRYVWNPLGLTPPATPFRLEIAADGTQTILSNIANAIGVYTMDQRSTSTFTSRFAVCVSHLMASNMAVKMTGKQFLKKAQFEEYRLALALASANDANTGIQEAPRDADHIRLRGAAPDWREYGSYGFNG